MEHYDLAVIGFGKAGKTLAKFAASQGKRVAMIERDQKMYGGTCINVGCIPSKTLIHDGLEGDSFESAFDRKRQVVSALNQKNITCWQMNLRLMSLMQLHNSNRIMKLCY